MRTAAILACVLSIPSMVVDLTAQPCIKVMTEANMNQPHRGTRFTPTTVAFLVPALPETKTICAVELFTYTRSAAAVSLPLWIYDRAPSGAPGNVLASASMPVGTNPGLYRVAVQATIAANADFFIAFDNAVGNLAPPVSRSGTFGTHYHTGPSWAGPFQSAAWMYRVFDSSGSVASAFTTTGIGCPGVYGVPRIGNVGTPVTGGAFQVTLANAPLRAPVVHVIGAVAASVDLGPLGAPGCVAEQLPLFSVPYTTSSTGAAGHVYVVPNDPTLLGGILRMQWATVDPSANQLGLALSRGGVATIGDF